MRHNHQKLSDLTGRNTVDTDRARQIIHESETRVREFFSRDNPMPKASQHIGRLSDRLPKHSPK